MNSDNRPTEASDETGTSGETETLKTLIAAAHTTQRQLSRDIDIAEVTINTWVSGRKMPRLDNAALVAAELGVSFKTLARSLQIDVSRIPGDYSLIDLKRLASDLGIERIEDLPEDYEFLKRRHDRLN
jgi:transcriptional regulator with XRE-family HTH domain